MTLDAATDLVPGGAEIKALAAGDVKGFAIAAAFDLAMVFAPETKEIQAGRVARKAATELGKSIESLKEFVHSGAGPWKRLTAHAEAATGRSYRGMTSMEEVFVHQQTGERLIRHSIFSTDGTVVHETFRRDAKFGLE